MSGHNRRSLLFYGEPSGVISGYVSPVIRNAQSLRKGRSADIAGCYDNMTPLLQGTGSALFDRIQRKSRRLNDQVTLKKGEKETYALPYPETGGSRLPGPIANGEEKSTAGRDIPVILT